MKGNQTPRIRIEPPRSGTDGKGAAMLMQSYGVTLDEWQQLVINCWLGHDETGNYNVTSAGLSVPRQNGKNLCLEARCFYGLLVGGEKILWTAHQLRTAKKSFRRLVSLFTDKKHKDIADAVQQIRYGIGEECITLHNGGQIEFAARSRQAARGYAGISLVVFDEAQELTDDQLEALMATLSASDTGTRQLIYVGTPPYAGCTGEVFRRFRQACIVSAGEDPRSSWHEWSIAAENLEDIDTADKRIWYETNPALGYRLTEEFTATEQQTLSKDGFSRERLGWWAKPTTIKTESAINADAWAACRSDELKPEGRTAYAVKFSADASQVVLAGAVLPAAGKGRITVIESRPTGLGLAWLVEWLNKRYKQASVVVIDGKGGADVLIDKIRPVWLFKDSVIKATAQNVVTAANLLTNEINEGTITWYSGQEALNDSALTAVKRSIGSGWAYGGAGAEMLEACALALWGVKTSKRDPTKKMRIG